MRLIVLSAALLVPAWASASSGVTQRQIRVTAQATTKVVPDLIIWTVSVSARHKNLVRAKQGTDRQVKDILKTARGLGVKATDLQTGQLSVDKEYTRPGYKSGAARKFKHYELSREVRIKQRGTDKFDAFLTGLIKDRDMSVSYRLASSKLGTLRAKTRIEAVKKAKIKAAAMAAAAGAKLGHVLTIDEHSGGMGTVRGRLDNNVSLGGGGADQGTFAPGSMTISVSVGASFELH
jgi:hypothetical protein